MVTIYLFDVDGTLTAARQPICEAFASAFLDWQEETQAIVYLVTGSNLKKTKQQIFEEFFRACAGVFCCSGNEMWQKGELIYQNKFRAPKGLLDDLNLYLESGAQYNIRTGCHIERRPGMINFSVLGRNANLLQREAYAKWNKSARELDDICSYVTQNYPTLDAVIGGVTSVDIYPKGRDKAQVVEKLRSKYPNEELSFVFVGDRIAPGGNDYPLAQELDKDPNSHSVRVHSYQETWALIEHSKLFIGEGGI